MTPRQLTNWRKRLGLSQAAAAKLMGISLRTYTRYERGEWPVPKLVELACEALTARGVENGGSE